MDRNSPSERIVLTVADEAGGTRLDSFIASSIPDLGRNRAKALILDSRVSIGGRTIVEPKKPVKPGEEITVDVPPAAPPRPQAEVMPLDVVYEDDALIVINKPAGLVVHPAAGNHTGTLVNALIAHCGDSLSGIGGVARPGIVHRLDKDTSGLLVVAKTDHAHKSLAAQFADHGRTGPLERGYIAIAWGLPVRIAGTVNAPLARALRNREKIEVKREGTIGAKEAITHYQAIETYGPADKPIASMIECRLETGRTHQIRVHMAHIGHPLIGDRIYGSGFATKSALLPEPARELADGMRRQALHAYLLGFEHPDTGEEMSFESDLPDDIQALADALSAL